MHKATYRRGGNDHALLSCLLSAHVKIQNLRGEPNMKIKLTMDRNAYSNSKANVVSKVVRELGSKATIQGDVIHVEEGWEERKVVEMLNWERVNYTKSR
jgi:hypothetical protein